MAKILIASLVDPATHPGGAGTYTRGLVAALQNGRKGYDVELVAPLHAPPGSWHRLRQAVSLAQSCFSKLPAKALFARQHEFRVRIRETIRSHRFDAVVINGSDMLWAADELPPEIPIVLIAHNLEHQLLAQQQSSYRFLSPILKRETTKQRHYEIEGFHRAAGVIFVSATEMAWSIARVPGLHALHVPPLFTIHPPPRHPQSRDQLRLGYLADFAWWPNRLNWLWLIDEVLPKVSRSLQVHVFGRQSEQVPLRNRVVCHGVVHNLATVWDQVDIMVCPTRAGAGVNIKVAESMYNRMPVLATPQAVRGFARVSGPGLVVIDKAEDWAAFLNSSEADQLATQYPSEELRGQFAVNRHAEKLKRFIGDSILDPALYSSRFGLPPPPETTWSRLASDGLPTANDSPAHMGEPHEFNP
jgi:glycosyltransferase involved in cell wall biosynthesis